MSDAPQLSLDEWCDLLPTPHRARTELARLRAIEARLRDDALPENLGGVTPHPIVALYRRAVLGEES